jgi:hypothetical protein
MLVQTEGALVMGYFKGAVLLKLCKNKHVLMLI